MNHLNVGTKQMLLQGSEALKKLFNKVVISEPHYTELRLLQHRIDFLLTQKEVATSLREKGVSIRKIASRLGYKHPGSVTHLLNKKK